MPVFHVYQPTLTNKQVNELNGPNGGWDAKPEFAAYAKLTFGTKTADDVYELLNIDGAIGLYTHVGDIEADGLEQAFLIGNSGLGPMDERITTYTSMRSVSVGDILVADDGIPMFCNRLGWTGLKPEIHTSLKEQTDEHLEDISQ